MRVMGIRKKILIALTISIVTIAVAYFFSNSYEYGLCFRDLATRTYDISCHKFYDGIGEFLFPTSIALSISLLALTLVPKAIIVWGRLTLATVLIGTLLIAITPQSNSGGLSGVVGFGPTRDEVTVWVSVIFAVLSLVIIGWSALRLRDHT